MAVEETSSNTPKSAGYRRAMASSSTHSLVLSRIAAFDVPYGLVDASVSAASKPSALYVKFQKLSDGHESDGYLPTAVRTTSLTERPEPAIFKDAELVLPLATGWRGGWLARRQ